MPLKEIYIYIFGDGLGPWRVLGLWGREGKDTEKSLFQVLWIAVAVKGL